MNKKLVTLVLSIGMGLSSLSATASFADPDASCEEQYNACVGTTCNPSYCQNLFPCGDGRPAH